KPKIATILWEEANTTCYQVRARGILVSRREDTDYINGTKLLNVIGMTRGKRDGILKTEKVRNVVKVGSMNLKGVWIPFERAYEIARNEGVEEILFPLFVND
ncbi:transcription regulator HTH, apses-type DNA-binding domain-containing protein, partial [Scheffersomyces coipomensis]|uniref:transcription regulator HTH, apses-type DNA-binding domain-containing protein n=1 Tax=Scheffersomyces coipomensis TaxID=1788519 RepID=UPI00315C56CE